MYHTQQASVCGCSRLGPYVYVIAYNRNPCITCLNIRKTYSHMKDYLASHFDLASGCKPGGKATYIQAII